MSATRPASVWYPRAMPPAARALKPTSKPIVTYYAALRGLADQKATHEQAVRSAFQDLLAAAARPHKWTPVPEQGAKMRGRRIVPDGTMRDAFSLPRGHWEAKDAADNLDAEIAAKIKKSCPLHDITLRTIRGGQAGAA